MFSIKSPQVPFFKNIVTIIYKLRSLLFHVNFLEVKYNKVLAAVAAFEIKEKWID